MVTVRPARMIEPDFLSKVLSAVSLDVSMGVLVELPAPVTILSLARSSILPPFLTEVTALITPSCFTSLPYSPTWPRSALIVPVEALTASPPVKLSFTFRTVWGLVRASVSRVSVISRS